MKRHYIYLAGNISDNPETYLWRERFTQECEKRNLNLGILNPCGNTFNQGLRPDGEKKGEIGLFERVRSTRGKGVLALKDFNMVKISTIIVANLAVVDADKPMIGTVVELTWAYDLKIPVIAIVDETFNWGKLYSRHPFMDRFISERVADEIEAVNIIEDFFIFV